MKTNVQTKADFAQLLSAGLLPLAFLLLATGSLIKAQSPLLKKGWDKTIGGRQGDRLFAQLSTADGGFLLGGSSDSNKGSDKSDDSRGRADYWVVRLDASGNKVWDKTLGGTGDDELIAMVATTDGGFLLGGYSNSGDGIDKSDTIRGNYDYWVVKIDAGGNKVWDKTLGGDGFDRLTSLVPTADGGFLLGGYSFSNKKGDKSQESKGGQDYWVIRLDAGGTKIWDRTLGGDDNDALYSMVATADGGFLLGGTSNSNAGGDKSVNRKGVDDYWVVNIDANGHKIGDKTLGGTSNDGLTSLVATADGGFLLGGTSFSDAGGDKSVNRKGSADYWAVKVDANLNKVWDKTLGGTDNDQLTSLVATADGGFLLGGFSLSGAGADKTGDSQGGADYWVVRLDASGNKVGDKTLGGVGDDQLRSMVVTADGDFLLGGSSDSNKGGDKSENSQGGADYWVVRLQACQQTKASLTASGPLSCASPTVILTATPSSGVTYAFSAGANQLGGGSTATVSRAGTYSVVITSPNGCVAAATVEVTTTAPPIGAILFVKAGAFGSGASWDCATGDLQAAINLATAGQQIWVAAGEYQPASGQSFSMKEGVKIYGGFAATGTPAFTDRNWAQHVTILRGNNNHVVYNDDNGLTSAALLDGFILTGGSAQTGGGMFNDGAYPLINHCVFTANQARQWGGGIYNAGAGTTIVANCLFYQNSAQSGGAAFSNSSATPRFLNVTLVANTATENGGAVHNYQSAATELINAIVWGNRQPPASSQLFSLELSLIRVYTSILEGGAQAIIGDKIIQGVSSQDPLFVSAASSDYRLQACSPAINQGDAGLITGELLTDLAGARRIYGGSIDLGAYEYQADQNCSSPTPVAWVKKQPLSAASATGIISLSASTGSYAPNTPISVSYTTPSSTTAIFTGITTPTGEILITGLLVGDYGPFVVAINGGLPSGPSNLVTLVDLETGVGAAPDLTPILYARPSTVSGNTPLTVVIDVVNLSAKATHGPITLKLPKEAMVSLHLSADATQVGSRPVQNGPWQMSDADPSYYVLTTSQVIAGKGRLSVGLEGRLSPGASPGQLTLRVDVLGGGESELTNNRDTEKIDYFPH